MDHLNAPAPVIVEFLELTRRAGIEPTDSRARMYLKYAQTLTRTWNAGELRHLCNILLSADSEEILCQYALDGVHVLALTRDDVVSLVRTDQ